MRTVSHNGTARQPSITHAALANAPSLRCFVAGDIFCSTCSWIQRYEIRFEINTPPTTVRKRLECA